MNKQLQLGMKEKQLAAEIGETRSDIKTYDGEESRFNSKYQARFTRNVLGQYETGILSETQSEYKKNLEDMQKEHVLVNK